MLSRFFAVVEKEVKTVWKDKIFLISLLVSPIVAFAIFGYTFQQNIDHLPTVIVDNDNSAYSQAVIEAAQNSEYFNVLAVNKISLAESLKKLNKSEIRAIINIPQNFGEDLDNAIAPSIFIYIDSSDYIVYNTLRAAIGGVVKDSLQEISMKIIGDLELEKEKNVKRVGDIKNLTNEIKLKIDSMKEGVNDINSQFSTFHSMLDDSKEKIENLSSQFNQLNSTLRQLNISFSIDFGSLVNFSEYESILNENEEKANNLKADSDFLFAKYANITKTVDDVDLQFKTLKKEFLTHPIELKEKLVFGEISYFKYLTAGIISLFLFFMCVFLTAVSIITEREKRTLYRLSTTPLRKSELLLGKFFTFFSIGLLLGIYSVLFTMLLFGVHYEGSLFNIFLIISLLSAVSVAIGLLVSVVVRTMRQALIVLPALLMPALLMSQIFAPIEVMPKFMQYAAKFIPIFYVNIALREVMIKGSSFAYIWHEVLILFAYTFIILLLGILFLKKRIE